MKPDILLMEPLLPEIEAALARIYDVHRPQELTQAAANRITAVVTGGGTGLPAQWFKRLPSLGLIAINGVGTDQIDLEQAKARHIHVTTTPGALTDDVADMAVSLMLAVFRRIPAGDSMVRAGAWANGDKLPLGRSPHGKCLGVLGLGQIGRTVAERCQGFGMDIAYYNRSDVQTPDAWARYFSPRELAERCDVLAVCIAATAATKNLVDRAMLDALGPHGILINVARGSIVDEDALINALAAERIAGAGLDVFKNEPKIRTELHQLENTVLAPHQGSATVETRHAMGEIILTNLTAFHAGQQPPTSVM